MARPKSPILTESELRLMDVLWDKDAATVREVVSALPKDRSLAYTTVMTLLQTLWKKGYLRYEKRGRAFVYHPVVDRTEARRGVIKYIVSRFFEGSPRLMMLNIVEDEAIDPKVVQDLKRLLEDSE